MAGSAAGFELFDQVEQRRCAGDLAAGDGVADARQVLHHDAAGADIEMADLGIAHLPVRQADIFARGAQKAVRTGRPQPIECRRFGLADGVIGGVVPPTPAIQNDQHNRPPPLHFAPFSRPVPSRARGQGGDIADRRASVNLCHQTVRRIDAAHGHGKRVRKMVFEMTERILVLVRHGQSEWNLKNLFTGWRDVDLTQKGIAEARHAGRMLKAQGIRFDLGFTSALIRAQPLARSGPRGDGPEQHSGHQGPPR